MNQKERIYSILIRYFLIILISFFTPEIFYLIFTPLTIYPVYFLFSIFFETSLQGDFIIINNLHLEIIEACIAGSAYYLLLILNLSIPNLKTKKRIKLILLSTLALLLFNILRIFIFGVLVYFNKPLFFLMHMFAWYFVSIIVILAIWFGEIYYYKIKEVPFYEDIKWIYSLSFFNKKIKKN